MFLTCGAGEDSWESLGLQGDPTSPSQRKSTLNIHWKDWFWNWSSDILATWCKPSTHWKRPWWWERFRLGGEGGGRGLDGWMASPTQRTWVWANSGDSEGQGRLACFSTWGCKESDSTKQLTKNCESYSFTPALVLLSESLDALPIQPTYMHTAQLDFCLTFAHKTPLHCSSSTFYLSKPWPLCKI